MKLLSLLLLICTSLIHFTQAQTNHIHQSLKRPVWQADSLIFKKIRSKKGKSITVIKGTQVKAKAFKNRRLKGFLHTLSADTLTVITKKGLHSIPMGSLNYMIIFHGFKKQMISGELISKGTLVAIPAALGLILGVRESLTGGDFEKQLYVGSATFSMAAAALILPGSLIRRKKLRTAKWAATPEPN
ncbi:MAG: hypothetical protein R8G66_10660 [Cytophagales bacterium]|nr:hypothetical protein [Cytophagales bacterium]